MLYICTNKTTTMNIFYLHSDPTVIPTVMYNKHVVKMILETAQLLCTTHHYYGSDAPYKSTHVNHPSTVWARNNTANYRWLYDHFIALCLEYEDRYNKTHLSYTKCADALEHPPVGMPESDTISKMPSCMDDEYIISDDPIINYRNYYINGKSSVANKDEKIITNLFGS